MISARMVQALRESGRLDTTYDVGLNDYHRIYKVTMLDILQRHPLFEILNVSAMKLETPKLKDLSEIRPVLERKYPKRVQNALTAMKEF